ncbi:flagellar hook-basal body complex protein, partial [bacterium]|nr:flagellar hook-basal body complex protein [bacterium]
PLDVAIQGNGMFVLKDGIDSREFLYSRAGNFGIDDQGYLTTQSGLLVQGRIYTGNTLSDTVEAIKIYSSQNMPGTKTTEITLAGNLNAADEILDDGTGALPTVDPTKPDTYNFKQTIKIFDSLGGEHTVQICFQKMGIDETTGDSKWSYFAFIDGSELASPETGWVPKSGGVLSFGANGELHSIVTPVTTEFTYGNFGDPNKTASIESQTLTLDFGTPTDQNGTGLDGITQTVSESSSISFYKQNGLASGELQSITVDENGLITGFFTNGQTRKIAQLAIASFANYAGLSKLGNNVFGETFASGSANLSAAGVGGLGKLVANALEMSNVDLAREFTNMITGQRGFQANSRIITTTDEMIQEALMIKR